MWLYSPIMDFGCFERLNTSEINAEVFEYENSILYTGEREFEARVERMYCDGRRIENDLDKAAEWVKNAADKNVTWAIREYRIFRSREEK